MTLAVSEARAAGLVGWAFTFTVGALNVVAPRGGNALTLGREGSFVAGSAE